MGSSEDATNEIDVAIDDVLTNALARERESVDARDLFAELSWTGPS